MRLLQPFAARPNYFDRNPTIVSQGYDNIIGPAGLTQRWIYTVPNARKAFIEGVNVASWRVTAAGAAAGIEDWVQYAPLAGGAAVYLAFIHWASNVVDFFDRIVGSGFGAMVAGDILKGSTLDGSTTGTVSHKVMAKAIEFDA